MTYTYSPYPFKRALTGLKEAGFRFVALGTNHREGGGKPTPILAPDAPAERQGNRHDVQGPGSRAIDDVLRDLP